MGNPTSLHCLTNPPLQDDPMTPLANPQVEIAQLIILRHALKLQSLGMKHSKISGKKLLKLATAFTQIQYKKGEYLKASDDLKIIYNNIMS